MHDIERGVERKKGTEVVPSNGHVEDYCRAIVSSFSSVSSRILSPVARLTSSISPRQLPPLSLVLSRDQPFFKLSLDLEGKQVPNGELMLKVDIELQNTC